MKFPRWTLYAVIALVAVVVFFMASPTVVAGCPGSQIHCPGVGCVSGPDKCIPGSKGGASAVFSREGFVSKTCPGNYRSDGP